ncbi:MAG TPA: hypothetical protein VGC66_10965 [Pyrinomonadaceae bacterium]
MMFDSAIDKRAAASASILIFRNRQLSINVSWPIAVYVDASRKP